MGRPDGHEGIKEPLMGRPDGHEGAKEPLIGRPDGHEGQGEPLMGRSDGHEQPNKPLIGRPDGHEGNGQPAGQDTQKEQLLGQPDGHEQNRQQLLGQPDGHDGRKQTLIGRPDGHQFGSESEDTSEYFEPWNENDEQVNWEAVYSDDYVVGAYDDEPLVRCKRPTCDQYCPNGFQTDETGCPVCACLEDACLNTTCETGFVCRLRDCQSERSCVKLTAQCVPFRESGVACAMPMCSAECPHGYLLDSRGCMTCDCITVSEIPSAQKGAVCPEVDCIAICLNGYQHDENDCLTCTCKGLSLSDVKKPICAVPMCADYCPTGYKNDANGCMTCACNDGSKPQVICAMPMCATRCASYKKDENGCQMCECGETEPVARPVVECPMIKCVAGCERYKKDANGCQACECDGATPAPLCGEKMCELGEICQERILNFRAKMMCIPKPLCFTTRETASGSRYNGRAAGSSHRGLSSTRFVPECESNGAYKPLQCNQLQAECWCVDDRGEEIDETRTSVYIEEHKPRCARNITVALSIRMMLAKAEQESFADAKATIAQQLTSALPEHISQWMVIDKQYIAVLSSTEVDGMSDRYQTNVLVRHDGESDLPSALEHMKRKMFLGRSNVLLPNANLIPVPESIVTEYKFSHTPRPPMPQRVSALDNGVYEESESLFQYCWRQRSAAILIGGLTCVILLSIILITALIICRRRRFQRRLNFERRQKLVNEISASSEKSLLDDRDDKVLLVSAEQIDDKTPLA